MFDRFSDDAKRLMSWSRQHAIRLGHDFIAPQHMLLGLLSLPECSGARLLAALQVDAATVQPKLEESLPAAGQRSLGQLPFTPEAKRVLEATLEAGMRLGSQVLGTTHLLVGLTTVEGPTSRVLAEHSVTTAALESHLTAARADELQVDQSRRRLLLISNSTMHGGGYLEHCAGEIRDFLGARRRVLFVPYALSDHDGYTAKARAAFAAMGHELLSAHECTPSATVLDRFDAIFIGGGNTFRLLDNLYRRGLLEPIRQRVMAGVPYIGSSAGTNVATLSIRTTNDMPIVQPPTFTALQLVPFQINPHYLDPDPASRHMGETREERIRQFLEEHATPVLGLREGCMLRVEGTKMELRGTTKARLFRRDRAAEEFSPPCDLSFLLQA